MKLFNYIITALCLLVLNSCVQGEGMKYGAGDSYTIKADLEGKAKVEGLYDKGLETFNFTLKWDSLYDTGTDAITGVVLYKGEDKSHPLRTLKYNNPNGDSEGSQNFTLSSYNGLNEEEENELLSNQLAVVVTTEKHPDGIVTGKLVTNGYNGTNSYKIELIKLRDNALSFSVEEGKTNKIPVVITPYYADNTKLKYTSSEPEIFTVDENGMVTGKHVGQAIITVESQDGTNIKKTFTVKVTHPDYIREVVFKNADNLEAIAGQPLQLEWTLNPEEPKNKNISFVSSDPTIATVDDNGLVTAKRSGTITVSAVATQTGIEGKPETRIVSTCTVKVYSVYQELDRTGWNVTATSYERGSEPTKLLDGNANSFWENRWKNGTGDKNTLPQSVTFDFGKVIEISKIEIDRRRGYETDTKTVKIALGDDPNKLEDIGTLEFGDKNNTATTGSFVFGLHTVRYVRLTFTESNRGKSVSAAEVRGYLIK